MPKKIEEQYRNNIKELMYNKGVELIKVKGIKKVTVEDVTKATGMAKGLFYQYYPSKEMFLYEVIKRNEKESFDKMISSNIPPDDMRTQLINIFENTIIAPNSLFLYLDMSEFELLLAKLPEEIRAQENAKCERNFGATAERFGLKNTPENFKTLAYLMDSLQFVAQNSVKHGGEERALKILENAIIDFIMEARDEK